MRPTDSVAGYLDSLAARSSTPGGGAVAAMSGAQGCALIAMVARFTRDDLKEIIDRADRARQRCLELASEDAECFDAVMAAWRLPAGERGDRLQTALTRAAEVPLELIETLLPLAADIETVETAGNPNLVTDAGIAAQQFLAAFDASRLNVRVNLRDIEDENFCRSAMITLGKVDEIAKRLDSVTHRVRDRLHP